MGRKGEWVVVVGEMNGEVVEDSTFWGGGRVGWRVVVVVDIIGARVVVVVVEGVEVKVRGNSRIGVVRVIGGGGGGGGVVVSFVVVEVLEVEEGVVVGVVVINVFVDGGSAVEVVEDVVCFSSATGCE